MCHQIDENLKLFGWAALVFIVCRLTRTSFEVQDDVRHLCEDMERMNYKIKALQRDADDWKCEVQHVERCDSGRTDRIGQMQNVRDFGEEIDTMNNEIAILQTKTEALTSTIHELEQITKFPSKWNREQDREVI